MVKSALITPRSIPHSFPMDIQLVGVERRSHIACPTDKLLPDSGAACHRGCQRRCVSPPRCHKAATEKLDPFQGARIAQSDSQRGVLLQGRTLWQDLEISLGSQG